MSFEERRRHVALAMAAEREESETPAEEDEPVVRWSLFDNWHDAPSMLRRQEGGEPCGI